MNFLVIYSVLDDGVRLQTLQYSLNRITGKVKGFLGSVWVVRIYSITADFIESKSLKR